MNEIKIPDPLVSVIIPCYNYGHYMEETLGSIKQQTFTNWECLIVNDGSTDNSREIIESLIKDDLRFKLVNIENSGVCVARNTAVKNTKGKYIFSMDADNKVHPDFIKRCIAEFENGKDIKLVYTEAEMFGAMTGLWNLPEYDYKTMLKYNMIDNCSIYLREDFDRVGGYRLNMVHGLEDWDFFIGLLAPYTNAQVIKIKDPLFYYRYTEGSRRSIKQDINNLILNNFEVYQKYFPELFDSIHKYGYYNMMMNKPLIKLMVKIYNQVSKLKQSAKSKKK